MEYKRLGDYISEVNVRNENASITNLLGVNLSKKFIPSVANIIGTDLSNYKVIQKGQFGCKLMSIGRDGILPISFKRDNEPAIISSAYYVFEVNDEKELSSEYLMLCFLRPEFDRQLAFYSGGDVRGGVSFDDFCNMPIPFPDIDEQRRIVAEYQTIEKRIENNNRLIRKLEDTAKTIYHHTFVENLDPDNLPEGWRIEKLDKVCKFKVGGDKPTIFSESKTDICRIPVYSNGVGKAGLFGYTDKAKVKEESITITARGNVGHCFLRRKPYTGVVRLVSVIPNEKDYLFYLYFNLSSRNFAGDASVQSQLPVPELSKEDIIVPTPDLCANFSKIVTPIYGYIDSVLEENIKLNDILNLLLAKFA